ncbi:MAG: M4 family metallopeptidase [Halobacteriota archaeon]
MSKGFEKIRFFVGEKSDDELQAVGTRGFAMRGIGRPRDLDETAVSFNNDEAAARYYLGKVLAQDSRPPVRGLAAEGRAKAVPDARMVSSQQLPYTATVLVQFDQMKDSIPIFGSRLNVEMDKGRELIGVTGAVKPVTGVSSMPSLGPSDALKRIEAFANLDEGSLQEKVQPPALRFFYEEEHERWHLAYSFKKVPAAPKEFLDSTTSQKRFGRPPQTTNPLLNYLVDAHDGKILLFYSAAPLAGVPEMPIKCTGLDELNAACEFWGRKVADGFELVDPLRMIRTYDHQLRDVNIDALPTELVKVEGATSYFNNKAAVSAQVNATRVYDFYKSVLIRDGIDDKGMDLVSIVNTTNSADQPAPEWFNACWWNDRMWYGQIKDNTGELMSFSRYLDVIGHELTHGVTEHTSELVYRDQSGALNESFSDTFGVMINNWHTPGGDSSVDGWNWEIGVGLGSNGLPLRDMSDPRRTNDPDHMDQYVHLPYTPAGDYGGVHTNSNIHNKAVYNVLTAKDEHNNSVFTPKEAAVLYYYCLMKLNSQATFSDVLETLQDVATVYYAGNDLEREKKITAIKDAYQKVGIK